MLNYLRACLIFFILFAAPCLIAYSDKAEHFVIPENAPVFNKFIFL